MNQKFPLKAFGFIGLFIAIGLFAARTEGAPGLALTLRSGLNVQLEASELEVNRPYVAQRSTNLVDWVEIRTRIPAGPKDVWSESRPKATACFYRLIQHPNQRQLVCASIYEGMKTSGVPALSITVITNGRIAWAAGFGLLAKGKPEGVDTNTLFQAASISKPTTAMAALRMVDQGVLSLSEPVNNKLKTLLIPGRSGSNVTLRHILSHTGGLTVSGFPGYAVGSSIPTLLQILKGQAPANTGAITASGNLGTWAYSGGGYTFLQALLIDITNERFPDLMRRLVLEPLDMSRSTFEQPLPSALQSNAARSHVGGAVFAGNWHVYPEMAAAGLWTTPTDLARLFIAVRSAYLGDAGALINQSTAEEMLTSQVADTFGPPWGLGVALALDQGRTFQFYHTGGNYGYLCAAIMFTQTGNGAAIMTNSDAWIIDDVLRACESAYGWP